jgi:hypothetical protein
MLHAIHYDHGDAGETSDLAGEGDFPGHTICAVLKFDAGSTECQPATW